jgi:cation:H+ antiporter
MTALLLVSGAALLVAGAELLVRGAARLAAAAGISPLVIGLTVVAFGTSAPELAVSVGATLNGQPDVASGNVIGSNIFNVLFILGASALVAPLTVQRQIVRFELPIMLGVSVLLLALTVDGFLGRTEGAVLFGGLAAYMFYLARSGAPAETVAGAVGAARSTGRATSVLLVAIGLALLVAGSRFFVDGAVRMASALGVSEIVIGLTIIAAGTSLPELATSVLASIRGERDIAVGNVVGSNIFNVLGILGICGLLGPDALPLDRSLIAFDLPVMIAVALIALPIMFTGLRISRIEGALLLLYYIAYTAFLILRATQHDALDEFSTLMLTLVLPLTLLPIVVSVMTSRRARRQ